MSLLNPNILLPPCTRLDLQGPNLAKATVERFAFFGGIVAVHHEIALPADQGPLTSEEEIALSLKAIGMSSQAIADATFQSIQAVIKQEGTACKKLGGTGDDKKASAMHQAFLQGVLRVVRPLSPVDHPGPRSRAQASEVISLVSQGKTRAQVAHQMGRSIGTVKNYLSPLKENHINTRGETLVLYGHLTGILSAD